MNKRRITNEKALFAGMCLEMGIPFVIIAKIFDVNQNTLRKYTKAAKEALAGAGPKTTRSELKLQLFKLYGWSVVEPIEMSMSLGVQEADIRKMQKAMSDYLKIERCIAYCHGVITEVLDFCEKTYDEKVKLHERRLVDEVFGTNWDYTHPYHDDLRLDRYPYHRSSSPGKILFSDCLKLIHKYPEKFMPTAEEISRPSTTLKKAIDTILMKKREWIGMPVTEKLAERIMKEFSGLPDYQRSAIQSKLDFPEQLVLPQLAERTNAYKQTLYNRGIRRIRDKFYFSYGDKEKIRTYDFTYWNLTSDTLLELHEAYAILREENANLVSKAENGQRAAMQLAAVVAGLYYNKEIPDDLVVALLNVNPDLQDQFKLSKEKMAEIEMRQKAGDKLITFLLKPIVDFDLSVRALNCLRCGVDIEYGWQMLGFSVQEYMKFRNFGKKSVNEIRELMRQHGASLEMEILPEILFYVAEKTIGLEVAREQGWIK